ncbi:MAG: hypothetical protein K6F97_10285 [Lachnospiraceae bacterium]|nr:hypothetical protein [Lachnospiraceae bacterium]
MNSYLRLIRKMMYLCSYILTLGIRVTPSNNDRAYLKKLSRRFGFLSKVFPIRMKHFLYVPSIIVKNSIEINNRKKEYIAELEKLLPEVSEKEAMIIISLSYLSGAYDDEMCKTILGYASNMKNNHFRYWITQNISKYNFFLQTGFYSDYYKDRKALVKKCAEELNITVPAVTCEKTGKRLCLVNYLQSSELLDSAQRVSTMVAHGLAKYYDEILVVVLDCFIEGKADEHKWGSIFHYKSSADDYEKILKLYPDKVKLEFCKGDNYSERFQNAMDIIYAFSPSAIIDLSDEYSLISYYYSKKFTTLSMPLRVGASSLFFNAIEGVDWRIDNLNNKYHFLNGENVINWSFPEFVPNEKIELTRDDYGLSEKAFVILTLGKCAAFCSEDFQDELCKYLSENPDAIWLIVGDIIPDYLQNNYYALVESGRVKSVSYEKKIGSLCSMCDVLLRVDATGGSGSTAIAAMYGLPIAMTDFPCDPMRWLGRDFSKIDNYKDLFEYIHRLQQDDSFYTLEQAKSKELVMNAVDGEKKWLELFEFIESKAR